MLYLGEQLFPTTGETPLNYVAISLVLYAHNAAPRLERATLELLALLPELANDYELIVVNDASDDATAPIADNLSAACDPVLVIHQPQRRGFVGALVEAASVARSELLIALTVGEAQLEEALRRLVAAHDLDLAVGYQRTPARRQTPRRPKAPHLRGSESGAVRIRTELLTQWVDTLPAPKRCADIYHSLIAQGTRWGEVEIETTSIPQPTDPSRPLAQRALLGTGLAALAGGVWLLRNRIRS